MIIVSVIIGTLKVNKRFKYNLLKLQERVYIDPEPVINGLTERQQKPTSRIQVL